MQSKIPVAILGATGSVGQRFVQLLDNHPWFRVAALTGSERSIGQTYEQACHWVLPEPMPVWARSSVILPSEPEQLGVQIAFSALHAEQALQIEPLFARAGITVCSNASAFRQDPDVPLLLPEVNADHAALVTIQRQRRGWEGAIVTNPNCTSTGLTIALKALADAFGLRRVLVVSMQAISGAGYPGVASLDILDNVIPYIPGEEDKIEWEPRKMLGALLDDHVHLAPVQISAHSNRVAVSEGHIVCASVELEQSATPEEARRVLLGYQGPEISRQLPSAPRPVIMVRDEPDRPQPRLDRHTGNGMTTVVGRLRKDPLFHLKFIVLSHNTLRGAAGGSIMNAELMMKMDMI
jgi:aspartate-semialdehyde dehydrogenase